MALKTMTGVKEKFSREIYSEEQWKEVRMGWNSSGNSDHGEIGDLDPREYSSQQMYAISLGRGNNSAYANVSKLSPRKYDGMQMHWISCGRRGTDKKYGNIDDLDSQRFNGAQMKTKSLMRRTWWYRLFRMIFPK